MRKIICTKDYFEKLSEKGVVLFGGGSKARQAIEVLRKKGIKILAVCDNDETLWGTEISPGLVIQNFSKIKQEYQDFIVLLTVAINNALPIYQTLGNTVECYQFCNPFKVEQGLLSDCEIEENQNQIQEIIDCFEDDRSRDIFIENINYKLTGNMLPLVEMVTGNNPLLTYFDDELFESNKTHVYVDVGAYTGDSITSFVMATRGNYKKLIAYEGDKGNYGALEQFKKYARLPRFDIKNYFLWSGCEERTVYTFSDNTGINYDSPNLYTGVDTIADNGTLHETRKLQIVPQKTSVHSDTLDHQFHNEDAPTIMKINAMAADFAIIKGGKNLIENYKPMLIFEYGVKRDDLFSMILWLKQVNPEYKFYLREKRIYRDIKTILYVK